MYFIEEDYTNFLRSYIKKVENFANYINSDVTIQGESLSGVNADQEDFIKEQLLDIVKESTTNLSTKPINEEYIKENTPPKVTTIL